MFAVSFIVCFLFDFPLRGFVMSGALFRPIKMAQQRAPTASPGCPEPLPTDPAYTTLSVMSILPRVALEFLCAV